MSPVSLRQVEAFKAVVEHGIVSRAATALGISQPALSKMIAALEHDSGVELFERRKGRLVPTDKGLRFYAEVDRIFVGLNQLQQALTDIRHVHDEHFRVGIIPALSGRLLQRTTLLYNQRRPQTHLSIHVRESQFLNDWIDHGRLDLLVASWATDIHGLMETPLMQADAVCLMPQGHELARYEVITPEHLVGQRYLSLTEDSLLPTRIRNLCKTLDIELKPILNVSSAAPLARMVEAGLGISLLHPLVIADAGVNVITRPFEPGITVDFHIYRPPAQSQRAASTEFVECLCQAARELCPATGNAAQT